MSRRKGKIALAPLIGAGLGLASYGMYIWKGYQAGEARAPGEGMKEAMNNAMAGMTGISQNLTTGELEFIPKNMMNGLVPVLIGSLGGWAVHKIASKAGVNKNIPWVSI